MRRPRRWAQMRSSWKLCDLADPRISSGDSASAPQDQLARNLRQRIRARGRDEIIFLNEQGEVVEGSRTNIFARVGGRLVTPPLSSGVLDGCCGVR